MNRLLAAAAALLIAAPALAQAPPVPAAQAAPAVQKIRATKLVLVGDSTTAVVGGWGPSFCARHVTSAAACVNLARGGRSSGSYRAEGSWDLALSEMSTPGFEATYVFIQFGHNDQPGTPGRSTDLATEFPANLRRYVQETRARGAIPVLVTPLTRRQFTGGRLDNDLLPWAEATRRVAAETRTPLVDLHARSTAVVQALGPLLSARFAQVPPSREVTEGLLSGTTIPGGTGVPTAATPAATLQNNAAVEPLGQARLAFDYTHLGEEGADFFAAMVAGDVVTAVPALRPVVIP